MKNSKLKRIGALILVFLLVAMYLITLILAFMKDPFAHKLFEVSVVVTIGLPVILYSYMLIYRYLNKRNDKDRSNDESNGHNNDNNI